MRSMRTFRTNAAAGGALVTVLLAVGMGASIHDFDAMATAQIEHIRAREREITLVERLRWNGELMVSAGRGYVISKDAAFLIRLQRVRAEFDKVRRSLRASALTPQSAALVTNVERDARAFIRMQEDLAAASKRPEDVDSVLVRFERDLVPLQRTLGQSLDRLVQNQEAALADIYRRAHTERNRLAAWLYGLLAALVALGSAITVYFARQTGEAYAKEQKALGIARKAVAAREDLMGIVAHDLRNPLHAISIQATYLQKSASSDKAREQAASILSTTAGMARLISSMLDVASMEAGQFSVTTTKCDVDEIMRASMRVFGAVASSKEIHLVPRVQHAGLAIRADRERVLQLLSNLLGNALKFAPQGSEVGLTVERRQEAVCFAISDAGPGIQAEHLQHIFDRFWKRETEGRKGTGLGLFIAKGIIEAHGGQISVESVPGRGTTFYFTLPKYEDQPGNTTAEDSSTGGCVIEAAEADVTRDLTRREVFVEAATENLRSAARD